MKRIALPFLLSLTVVATMALSGCSWTQRGAAGGGAVGAGAGALYGMNFAAPLTTAQAAMVGGAAGTAGGALVGDQFDQKSSRDAKRDLENLRAQLQDRESELAQLKAGNDPRVAELEGVTEQLRSSVESAEAQKAELAGKVETLESEIGRLRSAISDKETELAALSTRVQEKDSAVESLRDQLSDLNVQLEETNRGLTLTVLDQFLFEPGSAELSADGRKLISDVTYIIRSQFPGREIIVEGHTDNQPIVHSKWASNWELSSARALGIVHSMINDCGFDPAKVSVMAFGEFRPATSNATAEGRRMNRRAVIVILPEKMAFQKQVASALPR